MALEREGVNRLRLRLIGVTVQPLLELGIARVIGLVEIALRFDGAHQQPVAKLGDLAIRLGPTRGPLQREDAPITLRIGWG